MPPVRTRAAVAGAALAVTASVLGVPAAGGAAAEQRTVSLTAAEPRDDVFVVRGKVRPAYQERPVTVQRKRRKAVRWRTWRTIETNARSRYRQRVAPLKQPGVVCYRVKVPADDTYAAAVSDKVCIRTFWQ